MARSDLDVIITATSNVKDIVGGLIKQVADLKTTLQDVSKGSNVDDTTKSIKDLGEETEKTSEKLRGGLTEEAKLLHASIEEKRTAAAEDHAAKRESLDLQGGLVTASKESIKAEKDAEKAKKDGIKATRDAERATKDAAKAAEKLHDALVASGDGATILKDFLGGLVNKALVAGAALFALHEIIKAFRFAISEAAKEQELTTSLGALAQSAGYSAEQVNKTVAAVEGYGVSGEDARQSIQRLVQSNIDLGVATNLTATAQNLAVIAGTSTGDMLNKIAFSIQRLNPRMLLQSGIVVNLETAYKNYARTIGTTASALDDTQKRLAFIAELTAQGAKAADVAADAMGNYNNQVRAFDLSVENLGQAFGTAFLPAVTEIVRVSTAFIKNLTLIVQEAIGTSNITENLRGVIEKLGAAFTFVTNAITPMIRVVVLVIDGFLNLLNSTEGMILAFGLLGAAVAAFFPVLGLVVGALLLLKAAGVDFAEVLDFIMFTIRLVSIAIAEFVLTLADNWELSTLKIKRLWNDLMDFLGVTSDEEAAKIRKDINQQIEDVHRLAEARRGTIIDQAGGGTPGGAGTPGFDTATNAAVIASIQRQLIKTNEDLTESERTLTKAKESGSKEAYDAALKQFKALEDQKKQQMGIIEAIHAEEKAQSSLGQAREKQAHANALQEQNKKLVLETQKALDDLLGTTGKVIEATEVGGIKYENLTQANITGIENLEKVIKGYSTGVADANGNVVESFSQVRAALTAAFGNPKTVEDFTFFMDRLAKTSLEVNEVTERYGKNLAFAQQKAALTALNTELASFIAASETLRGLQTLYNQLVLDGANQGLAVAKVNAEVSNNKQAQYALELRSIAIAHEASERTFETDKSRILAIRDEKIKAATQTSTDEVSLAAKVRAATDEATVGIIASTKARYDALKTQVASALAQFKAAAAERVAIEKAAANEIKSIDQTIRQIKREGMTDEQQQGDRRREIVEAQEAFDSAILHKQFDEAKAAQERLKALAGEIKGGAGDPAQNRAEAIRIMQQAQDDARTLGEVQATAAKAAEVAAKASFESLGAELEQARLQLAELTGRQILRMQIEVDETSLQAAVQTIKSAFENVEVTVKAAIQAGGAAVQAARGGLIGGNSRAIDDQLILATSGEFMHPVAAVQYYGRSFMESIRNMTFPRFAMGGMIGEVGNHSVEHVSALDISFNKQPLGRVRGSRETLRGLVTALKEVERGVK